jgi:hypothetical protein
MLAHAGGVPEFLATMLAAGGFIAGWIGLSRIRHRAFAWMPSPVAYGLLVLAPVILVASIVVPQWFGPQIASGPRPRSTATLSFVEPEPGTTVSGKDLTVELDLEGGRIVEQTTTDITPNTGHIHVYLDGQLLSMTYSVEQDIDVGDLSPGAHDLTAEYVAADHAPFAPRVITRVTFVKGAS